MKIFIQLVSFPILIAFTIELIYLKNRFTHLGIIDYVSKQL